MKNLRILIFFFFLPSSVPAQLYYVYYKQFTIRTKWAITRTCTAHVHIYGINTCMYNSGWMKRVRSRITKTLIHKFKWIELTTCDAFSSLNLFSENLVDFFLFKHINVKRFSIVIAGKIMWRLPFIIKKNLNKYKFTHTHLTEISADFSLKLRTIL